MCEINDFELKNFMNSYYSEIFIRQYEDNILNILKLTAKMIPCKEHDDNWLQYSEFIAKRRGYKKDQDA